MKKMASAWREEILFEGEEAHRKEMEEPFCPPVIKYLGLCLTCNHALTCTFTRRPDLPVVYCEEFDISATPVPQLSRAVAVQPHGLGRSPSEGSLGLCGNCENRGTCALPRAEGGVWHCEEYL